MVAPRPEGEDSIYFEPYGEFDGQMNMITDEPRTLTYFEAIKHAAHHFADRVVLDVGSGSGLLSFFSSTAGAAHVYAVEASRAIDILRSLLLNNRQFQGRITPVHALLENVACGAEGEVVLERGQSEAAGLKRPRSFSSARAKIPPVEIIVSEPMGICLLCEGMLDTLVLARDRYLRTRDAATGAPPPWAMFPNKATLFVGLSSSAYFARYLGQETALWRRKNYFGIDWRSLHERAVFEILKRPLVMDVSSVIVYDDEEDESENENEAEVEVQLERDGEGEPDEEEAEQRAYCSDDEEQSTLSRASLTPVTGQKEFDLLTCTSKEFEEVRVNFLVGPLRSDQTITAFVVWFDCHFYGNFRLSTSPLEDPTHWHQTAFILERPVLLESGEVLQARFAMAKKDRSYNCCGQLYKDDICVAKTAVCSLANHAQV